MYAHDNWLILITPRIHPCGRAEPRAEPQTIPVTSLSLSLPQCPVLLGSSCHECHAIGGGPAPFFVSSKLGIMIHSNELPMMIASVPGLYGRRTTFVGMCVAPFTQLATSLLPWYSRQSRGRHLHVSLDWDTYTAQLSTRISWNATASASALRGFSSPPTLGIYSPAVLGQTSHQCSIWSACGMWLICSASCHICITGYSVVASSPSRPARDSLLSGVQLSCTTEHPDPKLLRPRQPCSYVTPFLQAHMSIVLL